MSGNLYGESSAAAEKDKYRWCRAGRHQLRRFRVNDGARFCAVCHGEWDASGRQVSAGELAAGLLKAGGIR